MYPYEADPEEALAAAVEQAFYAVSNDAATSYILQHGSNRQEAIDRSLDQARSLLGRGFFGPAVVAAATAVELTIRYLLVRPLVHGSFLWADWSESLVERIVSGQSHRDRDILPKLLWTRHIDIDSIEVRPGEKLWASYHRVVQVRNEVVHAGLEASREDAEVMIACAEKLDSDVVDALFQQLRISRDGRRSDDGSCPAE